MKHDAPTLLDTHRGKFLMVNSLARRIRALQSGHKALVPRRSDNLITLATEEFLQEKVIVTTLTDEEPPPEEAEELEAKEPKKK